MKDGGAEWNDETNSMAIVEGLIKKNILSEGIGPFARCEIL